MVHGFDSRACDSSLRALGRHQGCFLFWFLCLVHIGVRDGSGAWKTDVESQVHRKIDKVWSMLFDPNVVWATLDDVACGQVDQDGLDAASDDVLERFVRIMHTQGAGQCAEGGLGTGWSMVAVDYVRLGWTGQSDGTEDGEDRR